MQRPLANSYWVLDGRVLAGEYPLGRETLVTPAGQARVRALLDAGVTHFIDLTEEGECPPYQALLPATTRHLRHPIPDHDVPRSAAHMRRIQEAIGAALDAGHTVYVHCRAGIGRTGTAAGCLLVEQGWDGEAALRELNARWTEQCERAATWPEVPQTEEQAQYIREWRTGGSAAAGMADAELAPVRGLRDRFQGAMQGLAVGDALAAATQYRRPGSFPAVGDLLGGGPFDLPRGAWSDDTAMALCLAESLADSGGFDPRDQVERYSRWQRAGHRSATGVCLGITAATAQALATAQWRSQPFAGSHDPAQLHPEPLSRVAPVVLHTFANPGQAVELAADSARITCQAPLLLDACRLLAAMLHAALRGEPRERVLQPLQSVYGARPLRPEVAAIAASPYNSNAPPAQSNGNALQVLALARWAFGSTQSFREGALRAVNLGGHSDVIAAVCGQLAGAFYGVNAIPRGWRQALLQLDAIGELTDRLLRDALLQLGENVGVS